MFLFCCTLEACDGTKSTNLFEPGQREHLRIAKLHGHSKRAATKRIYKSHKLLNGFRIVRNGCEWLFWPIHWSNSPRTTKTTTAGRESTMENCHTHSLREPLNDNGVNKVPLNWSPIKLVLFQIKPAIDCVSSINQLALSDHCSEQYRTFDTAASSASQMVSSDAEMRLESATSCPDWTQLKTDCLSHSRSLPRASRVIA